MTGIEDEHIIRRAIVACKDKDGRFEIANVVNMLVMDPEEVNKVRVSNNWRSHIQKLFKQIIHQFKITELCNKCVFKALLSLWSEITNYGMINGCSISKVD